MDVFKKKIGLHRAQVEGADQKEAQFLTKILR